MMARGVFLVLLLAVLLYGFWRLVPVADRKPLLRETWFQILCGVASLVLVGLLWGISQ